MKVDPKSRRQGWLGATSPLNIHLQMDDAVLSPPPLALLVDNIPPGIHFSRPVYRVHWHRRLAFSPQKCFPRRGRKFPL